MLINRYLQLSGLAALLFLAGPLWGQNAPSLAPSPSPPRAALASDTTVRQQPEGRLAAPALRLKLNFPLLDLPYAFYASHVQEGAIANVGQTPTGYRPIKAWTNPSMEQSTQFSLDTRYALFYGTQRLLRRKPTDGRGKRIWKIGAEVLLNTGLDLGLPLSQAWQHEEFHWAVLTRFNISSHNTINDWLTDETNANTSDAIYVNRVLDENLVTLKATSNPDFVRLMAAGIEGEIYGGEQLQQHNFFYNTGSLNSLNILVRMLNPQVYLALCANKSRIHDEVSEGMANEGSSQSMRDFTGPDFTAWAYDVYNPNVPYAARGLNPNGNGYDRYIYDNKLTDAQYAWIKKESNLALLNLASPLNFFINSIPLKHYANGETLAGNFAFRYYATSFGNQLGLNLMVKKGKYNFFLNPALNQNLHHSFPSLEAMLIDHPVTPKLLVTTRLLAWRQPNNQEFQTAEGQAGGLVAATLNYRAGVFYPYTTLTYKTQGWVAGNVFLDNKFDVKLGVGVRFQRRLVA